MRRQALVVGINRYPKLKDKDGNIPQLTTPVRDAEAIARLLELYGGFEVKRLPFGLDEWQFDPNGLVNQNKLETAMRDLFAAKENIPDTALLFFTGIGVRRKNQPDKFEGFLATSDTKREGSTGKPAWGVSIQWLRRLLKESRVPQQIVWLVCGHSGELFEFPEDNEDKPGRDRCWIASSGAEDTLYVDADDRSPLVKALIQGLNPKSSNSPDWITSHTLKKFIETRPDEDFKIGANILQRPKIKNSPNYIILSGREGVSEDISDNYSEEVSILNILWKYTAKWFAVDDDKPQNNLDLVSIHQGETVSNYFEQPLLYPEKTDKYKQNIQEALGVIIPNDWWTKNSVNHLHEFLKCLCGRYFYGQNSGRGDRNLCVGSAYIVALMAHQQAWPDTNIKFLLDGVKWDNMDNAIFPIFGRQDPDSARASVIALYQLFFLLFKRQGQVTESQVKKALFCESGRILKIIFDWNATSKQKGRPSLAEKVSTFGSQKSIYFPEPVGNTTDAVIRVWKNLLISQEGFMNPGTIYMSGSTLVIAGNAV